MRNKWLITGLLVSLAINVALTGFVAGRLAPHGPRPADFDPALGPLRMLRDLPEERRDALRNAVRAHFRGMRGDIQRLRAAQREINEALAEEPFEPNHMRTALDGFRSALMDSQVDNHESLVQIAAAMTPAERRMLREAMTRSRHDRRYGRHGAAPGETPTRRGEER